VEIKAICRLFGQGIVPTAAGNNTGEWRCAALLFSIFSVKVSVFSSANISSVEGCPHAQTHPHPHTYTCVRRREEAQSSRGSISSSPRRKTFAPPKE